MAELNFTASKIDEQVKTPADAVDLSGQTLQGVPGEDEKPSRGNRGKKESSGTNPNYKQEYEAYLEACRKRKALIKAASDELATARGEKKQALAAWEVYINEKRLRLSKLQAEPAPTPPSKDL